METILDVLAHRAATQPERTAYRYVADGAVGAHEDDGEVTYAGLLARARGVAARLRAMDPPPRRAVLVYPSGIEFVVALYGCFLAGVTAVPAMPPFGRPDRALPRLRTITGDAGADVGLSTRAFVEGVVELWSPPGGWRATDEPGDSVAAPPGDAPAGAALPGAAPGALAVIQYTSGSTSAPKGVMLRHSQALAQVRDVAATIPDADPSWAFVNWMPLFHDGGLVGGVLLPMMLGIPSVIMSPEAFTTSPYRWLKLVSEQPATFSGSPNFGYELCLRKVTDAQRRTLDLSRYVLAINSGEPVRWSTLAAFAEAFRGCGFDPGAFVPAYGLAEATLLVSMRRRVRGVLPRAKRVVAVELEAGRVVEAAPDDTARAIAVVGCGEPVEGQRVAIVDPATGAPAEPGVVGEIWVAGPIVGDGYWPGEERTGAAPAGGDERFGAMLPGSDTRWLRTGDLGFVAGGVLYPTGRMKDMIIVRGRNLYPHDVEATVELAHPRLRRGCGAAFGLVVDGTEEVAVVFEVDEDAPFDENEVFRAMRAAVSDEHEASPVALALIRKQTLPKTSSGKIQRSATRASFLDGSLDPVAVWTSPRLAGDAAMEAFR